MALDRTECVEWDSNAIAVSWPGNWGTLTQLPLSYRAADRGKRWKDRWVGQKDLLGNKHMYSTLKCAKPPLGLSFMRTETLLSSFWELGHEWHPGSGHSQLSPEGATFSRWKLWLKKINNKCFWAACVLPGWVREGIRLLSLPQIQQASLAQILKNLKARLWPKFWDPNHFTFLQITQHTVNNICVEICMYLVQVDLCHYKLLLEWFELLRDCLEFFSKATSMAACGIEVLQNDICVALPVLTYLVLFVFVSLSITAVLSPGDI